MSALLPRSSVRLAVSIHSFVIEYVRLGPSNLLRRDPADTLVVILIPLVIACVACEGRVVPSI